MKRFRKTLEDKANKLASERGVVLWEQSITGILKREIALTADQLRRLREHQEEQFLGLLRLECYVDTDLMRLQQRIPKYMPYHFPEKEKFKQRLFEIEKERRNLSFRLQDKKHTLESRLLDLINKHEQLDI